MSRFTLIRDYPCPIDDLWRVLTKPDLVARWTITGRGGRPEDFLPVVGRRFRLVGRPLPGWDGTVHCEVLAVDPPHLLQYTWKDRTDARPSTVTYRLNSTTTGTRLTFEHTGLTGLGGLVMSRVLRRVRRTMLDQGLPPVLHALHSPE